MPGFRRACQATVATELATTEATVRVMIHRLWRRYHARLSQRAAQTEGSPTDIEVELRRLRRGLQS